MTKVSTSIIVPSINLAAEYKSLKKPINRAIKTVLNKGWFLMGEELANFEKEFSKYLGVKYVFGVSSGTDALTIALKSLDLEPGDEVIVPANVYPTIFGVNLGGVKVKLCDADADSLNISIEQIKKVYHPKVKVIVAVHLYGNPVDLEPIFKFCQEKKIFLIEDCAQAAGAVYQGKKVGNFGDINCFSFYPTKNLGSYGDGGMVVTNNPQLAKKIKLWRMYGEAGRYDSVLPGFNSRLSEFQAAILRTKLPYLDSWNSRRIEIAQMYQNNLQNLPLKILTTPVNGQSVYHLFVIQISQRDDLLKFLQKNNIGASIHYPLPIHLTGSFAHLGKKGYFPISETASQEILSLPIYPQMTNQQVNFVIKQITSFLRKQESRL